MLIFLFLYHYRLKIKKYGNNNVLSSAVFSNMMKDNIPSKSMLNDNEFIFVAFTIVNNITVMMKSLNTVSNRFLDLEYNFHLNTFMK